MAGQLQVSNLNAMMMTGGQAGIITDDQYNNAQIISVDSSRLLEQLDQGKIPVVCGFQGKTATGDFTTLGRGGSDTTAAALGAALMAECIEIYTDVEGIMTADPRIVKTAKILDKISYSEVAQLANHGAKVIHPRAVELAAKKKIPLVVKSTFSDAPGTLIGDMTEKQLHQPQHTDRVATGVAHLPQITQIKITVDTAKTHQESAQIFRSLADGNISIDVINVHPGQVMFTVAEAVADRALANLKVQNYAAEAIYQCAKVSVVGGGICEVPGVMANFVEALSVHNIQILQTVDSHTSISALVKMSDMEMAVKALHQQFGLAE
jgi:aspartate kinase